MNFLLYFFCLIFSGLAEASSVEGIPFKEVFFQVLNFFFFFFLLVFLVKKPLQKFYKDRRKNFLLFEEQAKKQKKEVEIKLQSWKSKIEELDFKKETIKQDAEKKGQKFLEAKDKELESLKKRLETAGKFFMHLESEKIKQNSFKKWQSEIVKRAETLLKTESLDTEFQQKMYKEFFKQMEGRR